MSTSRSIVFFSSDIESCVDHCLVQSDQYRDRLEFIEEVARQLKEIVRKETPKHSE